MEKVVLGITFGETFVGAGLDTAIIPLTNTTDHVVYDPVAFIELAWAHLSPSESSPGETGADACAKRGIFGLVYGKHISNGRIPWIIGLQEFISLIESIETNDSATATAPEEQGRVVVVYHRLDFSTDVLSVF